MGIVAPGLARALGLHLGWIARRALGLDVLSVQPNLASPTSSSTSRGKYK
jgi:hypothetical protein